MSSYTRELVEHLLPTVWDRSYAFGLENPTAPDPSMPRSKPDPSHSGTLWAHLADIRSAWKGAPLSHGQRIALLCYYGLGWSEPEIATHEGVSHQAISMRLFRGAGQMADYLNGTCASVMDEDDDEGETAAL